MKSKALLLALISCIFMISGCVKNQNEEAERLALEPTGYWYFGDNGERVWRTITPENIRPPTPPVTKNYAKPFGDGS